MVAKPCASIEYDHSRVVCTKELQKRNVWVTQEVVSKSSRQVGCLTKNIPAVLEIRGHAENMYGAVIILTVLLFK